MWIPFDFLVNAPKTHFGTTTVPSYAVGKYSPFNLIFNNIGFPCLNLAYYRVCVVVVLLLLIIVVVVFVVDVVVCVMLCFISLL